MGLAKFDQNVKYLRKFLRISWKDPQNCKNGSVKDVKMVV
jgi:hypothetical protein